MTTQPEFTLEEQIIAEMSKVWQGEILTGWFYP